MPRPSGAPRTTMFLAAGVATLLFACGGGGSDTPMPPGASGSLAVSSCVIAADASSCQATISWTSANATAPRVVLGAATLAATASGTLSITVSFGGQTVHVMDVGGIPLIVGIAPVDPLTGNATVIFPTNNPTNRVELRDPGGVLLDSEPALQWD